MPQVTVNHRGDMLFETKIGSHTLTIDVPPEMNGKDRGLTPPELFLVSLASCVAAFVTNYCRNANIDTEGISVELSCDKLQDPTRFGNFKAVIRIPKGDYLSRENAILRVAQHCPVHETLCTVDHVEIAVQR